MTLKTDTDLRKAWEHATDQVVPVCHWLTSQNIL
jgi:hypothetical protein